MKVRLLEIQNFRGVKSGRVIFDGDTLLVGGNNIGKSTVCEALDLVLGPERLFRRPVVDEHDFFRGAYLDQDNENAPVAISIRVVLTDLSEEAMRHFSDKVRLWDEGAETFIDEQPGGADHADGDSVIWALPVLFLARYSRDEDEFEADTFFDHGAPNPEELDEEELAELGQRRARFTRRHKRLCGFVYLRALRTGTRALGLQRGSLLDTVLRLAGDGAAEMWLDTLSTLRDLDPGIGEIEQLKDIRSRVRDRMGKFVNLSPNDDSTGFFASELTREHLREVVRLFIATSPSDHPVPFSRQGAGSLNLLVFALLTIIAELKGSQSVIFAMEEPEIALPPHTQRRVMRHVREEMGQTIVTSHSPYVIEQFEPDQLVMLTRQEEHALVGTPFDLGDIKPKAYRAERRQFAEAVLAKGVIVVEGPTEASVLPIVSSVLEQSREGYVHLDLAGVSIFVAPGDGSVPKYGPFFHALDKLVFGLTDKPTSPFTVDQNTMLAGYDKYWESPEAGIERLLTKQVPTAVLRRFLDDVSKRSDYPTNVTYTEETPDEVLETVAFDVLKARKGDGWGYAAMLVEHCQDKSELPEFLVTALLDIDGALKATPDEEPGGDA